MNSIPEGPMLYVPAGDRRKLDKIPQLDAPAFILDLEDAVAISQKARARAAVAEVLARPTRAAMWVRVNHAPPAALYEDLLTVVVDGLDGVVLPKVERPEDVGRVDWILHALEPRSANVANIRIIATIESAIGLANIDAIATATDRIDALGFGAGDLSLELGLEWPPPDGELGETILAAKSQLVLASRRAALAPPHDGSYPQYNDADGLRREAMQSRRLGFGSKHAIHPAQVPIIQEVFSPTEAELKRAQEIVDSFERSESQGLANASVDGRLVDYPVAERARRLLARAGESAERTRAEQSTRTGAGQAEGYAVI